MPHGPPPDELAPLLPASVHDYAVFAVDLDGRVATWPPAAERLTGRAAADALGMPLAEVRGGEDGAAAVEALLARAASGEGARDEGWWTRADGRSWWGEASVAPVRGGDGEVAGCSVVVHDATARREADVEMRRARATFEGILAIASDAVVCVGEEQRIQFFNAGAERIFGYGAAEVLGAPLETLIPERHRPAHAERVRAFGDGTVHARRMGERGEISGRRKGGEIFPAEASISRLDVGGARVYTAVLRDVTDRRRAEDALARQAEELARSNADLEQFAYVASHDLQEPLRMVASYTQLLARRYRDRLDEDAHEFIGYAVEGVTRMQALINDLLAYSRVGTGSGEARAVELEAVLGRVLRSLEAAVEEAGARVTHDPLPTVRGDEGQLGQLLQNLVGNAIKFRRPDAAPHVHLSAARGDGEWEIAVRDNGIGIEAEFADRIFVIFQRLQPRGEYPGTGIGLAICKKIVERHGGRIWVEGTPGVGTTFRFTLPDGRGEP
jgi:PAS domain S-box-containing protein